MNKSLAGLFITFFLAVQAFLHGADPKPNFVFILADDMGWNDVGFCGNKFIDTPHLDALARSGVVFSNAYACAPNCAPTRACLLTGQYTPRHGVYTVVDERHAPGSPHQKILAAESRAELPAEAVTLPEALKPEGYATALFGMWNLGRGRSGNGTPTSHGFDLYVEPKTLGFEKDAYRKPDGTYSSDALAASAIHWIEEVKDRPFFLYLAFHDVHAPFDPKPELLKKYQDRPGVPDPQLAASVEAMDANVGRILEALKRLHLTEKTFVFFTSDNGGTREYIAPLRGGKGTLYEGGLRVPAIISGPGIPSSKSCDAKMLTMDFYPTILEMAGLPRPHSQTLDGTSLLPLALGKTDAPTRDLFWHFPSYSGPTSPASAIHSGDWKLIEFFETGKTELYNLAQDPFESIDLTAKEPDKARYLLAKLKSWQSELRAPCPSSPNPNYDPKALRKQRPDGSDKGTRKSHPGKTSPDSSQ